MKKHLSIILALIMLLSCLPLTVFAADGSCDCGTLPVVYVKGRSTIYEDKDDPRSAQLPQTPDGYIEEAAKDLIKPLAKGILTNNYSEYTQVLTEKVEVIYDNFSPDENGNLPGNTGSAYCPTPAEIGDIHKNVNTATELDAVNYLEDYLFFYDCRLYPVDIADDLNEYIEQVKAVTGHSKVNLVARCMGACIASAYFAEYGWDSINSVLIYNTTNNGTDVTNNIFTGNFSLNAEALDHFASQELTDDTALMDLIRASVTMYNKTYRLDIAADILNILVKNIAEEAAPQIIRATYGTMGGYWAMVGGDCYEEARAFVFPEEVQEQYAAIIAKFDEYYQNVSSRLTDLYTEMAEDGVKFNIITKYNYQLYPLGESSNENSDGIITVSQQSFGATAADYGYRLPDSYIEKAKEEGRDKYISSDRIIDASTALFPDHTWFMKDMDHNTFPRVVNLLMAELVADPDMTVWDNENYPQYLVFTKGENKQGTLAPLTEEFSGIEHLDVKYFRSIINFIKKLFVWLREVFSSKFGSSGDKTETTTDVQTLSVTETVIIPRTDAPLNLSAADTLIVMPDEEPENQTPADRLTAVFTRLKNFFVSIFNLIFNIPTPII